MSTDPFAGFDLERAIAASAASAGVAIGSEWIVKLAEHAREVKRANDRLHLTTIVDPEEFVVRHLGESFQGARRIRADAVGRLLDVGSGNGYPGIPLAAARPGLRPLLAEASRKKADFLAGVVSRLDLTAIEVLRRQVQRPPDLEGSGPFVAIVSRAMGHWEKVLPRLAPLLEPGGRLLLWAGGEVDTIAKREAWKRYILVERSELSGRERSWIWTFEPAPRTLETRLISLPRLENKRK